MKVVVPRESMRRLLRLFQLALGAVAVAMLGYCAFVLTDTWNFQSEASRAFDRQALRPFRPPAARTPEPSELVGRIDIPRLGVSVVVAEGTDEATLRRAAGHILGTGLPGHAGNVGIAGHRDTLFRPLRDIRQDDVIMLTTLEGDYRYRVVSAQVVSPSDVDVLNADGHEILTLVTCHPFYFIGPAPNRFIVRAARVL